MNKDFVKENETIVNAYYKGLWDQCVSYSVPHVTIPYRCYLSADTAIAFRIKAIINERDESGRKKYKRALFIGPTGSGKTSLFATLCREFEGFATMLTPNKIQNIQNEYEYQLKAIVGGTYASHKNIIPERGYSIVYDLASHFTNALRTNKTEQSLIIIDEPQELYYAKGYRSDALEQIRELEDLSSELDNSTVIHLTATPDILLAELYDIIVIFEDIDRSPVANKLDIIENTSKLAFEDGLMHLIVDMVKNKNEKPLIEIQSIDIINNIRNKLNSLGITAVSLSSKDKESSKTFLNPTTGKLEASSDNDMFKAIIENSCLPMYTQNGKLVDVYLSTSIIGQGTSIKGIIDKGGNCHQCPNLIPVYTVKDKATCSIDYVLQFLARPRYHVNRVIVFVNKENNDAKIQKCINIAKAMPGVSVREIQDGNYHISTKSLKSFKDLKKACRNFNLHYEKYEEDALYKVVVFGNTFKSKTEVMNYHISVAKANFKRFSTIYSEADMTNDNIDTVNETLDTILGLYCVDGAKNSLNIIKRNADGLYIDKEVLWLNIYLDYIGQYYRCNDLYYQELSVQLEMPFDISPLELTDIDLKELKQNHQVLIHETLSHAKNNDPSFKERILDNQLKDEMKWLNGTEEFKFLSAITKLTGDLDDAFEIISKNEIKVVKNIYDKKLREKFSALTSKERLILESYSLTKKTGIPLDDVAKLIIDSDYWLQFTRGLKLGVSMETLCYQFGKAPSYEVAKNYVDKTQTVNLIKRYTIKELESFGRAGMEIVVAMGMFYDSHNGKFWDNKNKVTIKEIDNLRIALNENKVITSLRYDTSGIGKSGVEYTKKDARNLLSCIFILGTPKDDAEADVLFILLRIAKAAK